jgi:hypothetical protein
MKICGLTTLPEQFTWTPAILLLMIKEIEKICPEEGQLNISEIERDMTTTDANINPMIE